MSWVKLDDGYASHPKVAALGTDRALGIALDIAAICYAAQHLTDGFIPRGAIQTLLPSRRAYHVAKLLVSVGRWEAVDGGYVIHDYLVYNPSRAQVLARREQAASAGHARADAAPREGGRFASEQPTPDPTDALVTYCQLTNRARPSAAALDWINRLTSAFGELPVVEAMVAAWQEEPSIQTLLGRTEGKCQVRARSEESAREKRKRTERIESAMWARRMEWFRNTGQWPDEWGNKPEEGAA